MRRTRLLVFLLAFLAGCSTVRTPVISRASPCGARGFVFVADGAGGNYHASQSITAVAEEMRCALHVRSFEWTHPNSLGLSDVVDVEWSRCKGKLLVEEICRYRSAFPGVPVYLVGFSGGSSVALAAAESLPYDSLERIILLAPSVSSGYDLRRALASSRQGLDAFTSVRDTFYLGMGIDIVGTSDGTRGAAAGRVGFCPLQLSAEEMWLANRLRQHPWNPSVAWTGNQGAHSDSLQPAYVKSFILPLLTPAR